MLLKNGLKLVGLVLVLVLVVASGVILMNPNWSNRLGLYLIGAVIPILLILQMVSPMPKTPRRFVRKEEEALPAKKK
jgi:hypothetical protein